MSALLEQLREALARQYEVERELASGGMGTVFLARDTVLDREVAVKVVRPEEDSATAARRLLNEARLLARFSHPNVVSIYQAGELGESFYYVMDYVKGETLEERLKRGRLSADEAVQVGSDVLAALEAAHEHGIVHRDVKPSNVFLVKDRALLGDFGIAKRAETVSTGITKSGHRVGTPGYMPPEQVAGDEVTPATDLYALGMVLYEALSGRRWAVQMTPDAEADWSGIPPGLVPVLKRALAWAPEERWTDAAAFRSGLRNARGLLKRRKTVVASAFGLTLLGIVSGGYALLRVIDIRPAGSSVGSEVGPQQDRVVLADFKTNTGDSELAIAATQLLRTHLSQSTFVSLADMDYVKRVLARMGKGAVNELDYDLAREVAIREGAKAVIEGEINSIGGHYIISARLAEPQNGQTFIMLWEEADSDTAIIDAMDRLAKGLRERMGESLNSIRANPPLAQVTTRSLEALQKYSQALHQVEGNVDRMLELLEEAAILDTTFASAWLRIAAFLYTQGENPARQIEAMTRAFRFRQRLTERERYNVVGSYHIIVTADYSKASNAYWTLLDLYPDDWWGLNVLAWIYRSYLREYERAEELARRAIEADSLAGGEPYYNAAMAQGSLGKFGAAKSTLDRVMEKSPLGGDTAWTHYFYSQLASAQGDYDSAEDHVLTIREATAKDEPRWLWTTSRDLAALAQVRGRLTEAEGHLRDAMRVNAQRELAIEYLQDAGYLAYLDLRLRETPERGLRDIEAALDRYPLSGLESFDRPYLLLAAVYAVAGRPDVARLFVAEFETEVDTLLQKRRTEERHRALGLIALAEGHLERAITEFRLQDEASGCPICALADLGRAYELAGRPDSAIAVYERYVETPYFSRLNGDPFDLRVDGDGFNLAYVYERLGALYSKRGDSLKAANYFDKLVRLWANADPELQPRVEAARRAIVAM